MATNTLRRRVWEHRWHYVFLIPMAVLFVMFTAWPMIASWYYAFFDWDGIGPATNFVGLDNFVSVITNWRFWVAFRNSLIFSLAAVVIQIPIALLMAMLLNSPRLRGRTIYRLLLFLPVVTTTAVVGIIIAIILDPTSGPVNAVLLALGLGEPVNFLGSENVALPTLVVVSIWKSIGVTLIYWLAALQTIPTELYEAARVDGANGRRTLLNVTLPMLVPIGAIILLLTFQDSLNPFDLVQATTKGGPNLSTDVVSTFIYRYAFDPSEGLALPRYGYACAAGVVFGVFTLVITAVQAPLLRRRFGRGVQ